MEDRRIQQNFVVLCRELNVERILPYLLQERMVTRDEYEELMKLGSSREKRQRLLLILPRKGKDHFVKFFHCLVWSGQADLARKLPGLDVDKVPSCPHQIEPEPEPQDLGQNSAQLFQMFHHFLHAQQQQLPPNQAGEWNQPPPGYGPSHPAGNPMASSSRAQQVQSMAAPAVVVAPPPPGMRPHPGELGGYHALPVVGGNPGPVNHPRGMKPAPQPPKNDGTTQSVPMGGEVSSSQRSQATGAPLPPSQGSSGTVQPPLPTHSHLDQYQREEKRGQPTSPAGHGQDQGSKKKVLLLYCKHGYHEADIPPDDFCENVHNLASLLCLIGGMDVRFDGFDDQPLRDNWGQWVEKECNESDFVLLVCSPRLIDLVFRCEQGSVVEMKRGKLFPQPVQNFIQRYPLKVIPVFLNMERYEDSWIPNALKANTHYCLKVQELFEEVGDAEGDESEEEYAERLSGVLSARPAFEKIVELCCQLRGEVFNPRPEGPCKPIPLNYPPQQQQQHEQQRQHEQQHQQEQHSASSAGTEEAVLSDEQMMTVAERIACYDWQRVGIRLGISYTQLESLRKVHSADPSAAVMAMLAKWLEKGRKEKHTSAEMKPALKSALEKMKFGRLAGEIFPDI